MATDAQVRPSQLLLVILSLNHDLLSLLTCRLLSLSVGMLSPRNLRVSDEWYTRFRVAWDPVAAPVQGYRLTYTPAGETPETQTPLVSQPPHWSHWSHIPPH